MATIVNGVINATKPKPPEPKGSPKDFEWPVSSNATDKERQAFAATLQELLPTKQWNHSSLAKQLWGTDKNGMSRNVGKTREWVRGSGYFPNHLEAGYIAQVLGVSMARLLQPEGKFDAMSSLIRPARKPMKPSSEWNRKGTPGPKAKSKAKANGHDEDSRWVLPPGVAAPTVKFETSKKHQSLVMLTLQGEMPLEVAMAIMSMANAKSGD